MYILITLQFQVHYLLKMLGCFNPFFLTQNWVKTNPAFFRVYKYFDAIK